jgi:POT family proton-dependent oligopeptide transporter
MLAASHIVVAGSTAGAAVRVSFWWLVGCYFLQSIGELSLSPVGLSSMTKLAPRRFVGQMMGIWFTADALGNLIAGLVGGHVNPNNLNEMPQLFGRTANSLAIAAVVIGILIIPIRRMMESRGGDDAQASY